MRIENHSEIEHNSRSVKFIQVEQKQHLTETRPLEYDDQSIKLHTSMDLKNMREAI